MTLHLSAEAGNLDFMGNKVTRITKMGLYGESY